MEIIDYFRDSRQSLWLSQIENFEWRAAKYLAQLLKEDAFRKIIHPGTLYLLVEGDELVSFLTLAQRDEIEDATMFPWIGFVHTSPAWRGRRCVGQLIEHACSVAQQHGMKQVHISTDHVGLYEKYGFTFIGTRTVNDEETRVYCRVLSPQEG